MKLIVGLGNPGEEYAKTRHNIGRNIIEMIAEKEKIKFSSKRSLQAAVASLEWEGQQVSLAYPLTYMNLSGEAVVALVAYFKIESLKDILIVVDDVAIPFGKFRLRPEGSSGGHNGLGSIEDRLGNQYYPRLRIGIGVPEGKDFSSVCGEGGLREYVLSPFHPKEEKRMSGLLEKGVEACRLWVSEPFDKAMSRVNATEL